MVAHFTALMASCLAPYACVTLPSGPPLSESPPIALLRRALESRQKSIQSYRAEVVETIGPGRDVNLIAQTLRATAAEFRKTTEPALLRRVTALEEDARRYSGWEAEHFAYRVAWRAQDLVRIEEYGQLGKGGGYNVEARLLVFTGSRWLVYAPRSRLAPGSGRNPETGRMSMQSSLGASPSPMVLACVAIPVGRVFEDTFALSGFAQQTGQVTWTELLRLVQGGTASVKDEQLPESTVRVPVLTLTSPPLKEIGQGLYKFRIFIDPGSGHMPVRLEVYDLVTGIPGTEPHYRFEYVIEWQKPVFTDSGVGVPSACRMGGAVSFAKPEPGKPHAQWMLVGYEITCKHYELKRIKTNETIADGAFDISPPAGTQVTDFTSSQTYVVGSAGEALERAAIAAQAEVGRGIKPVPLWQRPWFIVCMGAALVVAIGIIVTIRRRRIA